MNANQKRRAKENKRRRKEEFLKQKPTNLGQVKDKIKKDKTLTTKQKQMAEAHVKLIEEMAKRPQPCVICGNPPDEVGMLYVDDEKLKKALNVPEGKTRIIPYMICKDCFLMDDMTTKAEEAIVRSVQKHGIEVMKL